jgi:hypothetical protein
MLSLPSTVKGFIVNIPDEVHHPPSDNKTISPNKRQFDSGWIFRSYSLSFKI